MELAIAFVSITALAVAGELWRPRTTAALSLALAACAISVAVKVDALILTALAAPACCTVTAGPLRTQARQAAVALGAVAVALVLIGRPLVGATSALVAIVLFFAALPRSTADASDTTASDTPAGPPAVTSQWSPAETVTTPGFHAIPVAARRTSPVPPTTNPHS